MSNSSCTTWDKDWMTPNPSFYVIYSILAVTGVVLNSHLIFAYFKNGRSVLGERLTFNLLLRTLSVLDAILLLFLVINITWIGLCGDHSNENPAMSVFYSFRNLLISYESTVLVLMACDRFLAIRCPFTPYWNIKLIVSFGLVLAFSIAFADLILRSIMVTTVDCEFKKSLNSTYLKVYGITAVAYVIFIFGLYTATLVSYLVFTHRRTRTISQFNSPPTPNSSSSSYSYSKRRSSTQSTILEAFEVIIPSSSSASTMESVSDAERSTGNRSDQCEINSVRRPSGYRPSPVALARELRMELQRSCRIGKILCSITAVYLLSIIPFFLINMKLVNHFYELYYLLYLNPVTNPIIQFITNKQLRRFIRDRYNTMWKNCGKTSCVVSQSSQLKKV